MLKPELGSECQLVPLALPALPVLPAGLCSECRVVLLRGADDVTLVLQQLQHLLQHGLTQAWAEAQAGTGQDVQEVAALLHVCGKKGVGAAWTHLSDPLLSPYPLCSPLHGSPSLYFLNQNLQLHKTSPPAPMVLCTLKQEMHWPILPRTTNQITCAQACARDHCSGTQAFSLPGFPVSNCILITPWGCSAWSSFSLGKSHVQVHRFSANPLASQVGALLRWTAEPACSSLLIPSVNPGPWDCNGDLWPLLTPLCLGFQTVCLWWLCSRNFSPSTRTNGTICDSSGWLTTFLIEINHFAIAVFILKLWGSWNQFSGLWLAFFSYQTDWGRPEYEITECIAF